MDDKATEELAKLGQKSLDVAEKTGGWLSRVFGGGFNQLGAAFEDSMAAFRIRNRIRVLEKTRKTIEDSGLSGNTRAIDPRVALPLIDAISDESDEDLQTVWSAYISSTLNPAKPPPDRVLIDIIRRLSPEDWPIIKMLFRAPASTLHEANIPVDKKNLMSTMDRLASLNLFAYEDSRAGFIVMNHYQGTLSVELETGSYYETKLFRRLQDETRYAWEANLRSKGQRGNRHLSPKVNTQRTGLLTRPKARPASVGVSLPSESLSTNPRFTR